MSFFKKLFNRNIRRINITICGLDNAGKTTIVKFLIAGEFTDTIPTMGINRETINFPNLKMDIFDLGGQKNFRTLWSDINEKSDGIVFVIDSSDFERLDESKKVFHDLIKTQINQNIPVLVLLNKCDKEKRITRPEFIEYFEINNFSDISWACFVTSAVTSEGIFDAFKWFIDRFQKEK